LSAKDTKYEFFGRLISFARAEPEAVAKHGRSIAVMAIETYRRLKIFEMGHK
jgi:hypothetical protein